MAATLDARIRLDSSQFSGGLNRAMRETNVAVGKMSAQFGTLRNVLAGGAVGAFAASWAGGLLEASIQAEKLEAALSVTTGSKSIGETQLKQVKQLAGDIGLGVNEAAKAMIQFQSAGMSSAQSMKAIQAGFNAIMSTGGGANEFSRFAIAIQQLRSSPKPLQEEINQLREALPTTAKLMKEAFGATRAEDIQKLNISGEEFVNTLLAAIEKLPQVGDTMAKQIGRFNQQLDDFKAQLGTAARPGLEFGMGLVSGTLQGIKSIADSAAASFAQLAGYDVEAMNRAEQRQAEENAARGETKQSLDEAAKSAEKDAASKNRSIEQGKTLSTIFGKFNDILREGAKAAREFAAELDFEDRMNVFKDQERNSAWEDSLDETRRKTAEAIRAKREAQGDAFNDFVGPQQMTDDEREDWRNRIAREGMTRSDRKAERAAKREQEENTRKAADRKTREQMREIEKEKRANAFDDLKKNKGFFDEEGTKRRLKDKNREDAKHAVQSAAQTLTDIKAILQTLATA